MLKGSQRTIGTFSHLPLLCANWHNYLRFRSQFPCYHESCAPNMYLKVKKKKKQVMKQFYFSLQEVKVICPV